MELVKLFKPICSISQIIGPAMSAGQKERVAGSMVRLMLATGKFKGFLFIYLNMY